MTKFEEEVKRPKKAYIDPFSKRDVDFTGVARKFTEGAQTLKEWKEYAGYLEYDSKQKDERILKLENENSFLRDEHTTFDSNGMAVEPKLQQQALPVVPGCVAKTVELLKNYPNSSWTSLYESLGEAGYATGGYVDRLVFSGLDVHEMLNEIEQAIDTDKLSVEKLQEQLNTAKKALTESEKMYQKQRDRFLNSEMNESARSHCESQLKLLFPAHKAYEVLAAIGGIDE